MQICFGRDFLIGRVAAGVRPKGARTIGLRADNNGVPACRHADFPSRNEMSTVN
jgi:hypothetical protein